jgi:dienelactone hydrolase
MRLSRLLAPVAIPALALSLAAQAPNATDMALSTPDGFALKGTLIMPVTKGKVPVVILAHQFHTDRTGWLPLTERLLSRGIGVLAMDLRGHGASTIKASEVVRVSEDFKASAAAVGFDQIPADLAQAAAWLRKQPGVDGRRIGLAGSSVGAFSVIMAAPAIHPVAVLSLSPAGGVAFGDGALDKLKAAQLRGRASTLVLASSGDKDAFQSAQALKDLPGVALNLKEGDEHGFAYFKERADLMAVFFGEYLTYHHTGKAYAPASTQPAPTPGNVINDKTLAEKKAAEGPK